MTGQADEQELYLVRAVDGARAAARVLAAELRGARKADRAVTAAGLRAGRTVPSWARTALSAEVAAADEAWNAALADEAAAIRELRAHNDRRIAAALRPLGTWGA